MGPLAAPFGGRSSWSLTITNTPSERTTSTPIRIYVEPALETALVCDKCTLKYAIYGVFAFCPDCGVHNSLLILNKNFDFVRKLLTFADTTDADTRERVVSENWCGVRVA